MQLVYIKNEWKNLQFRHKLKPGSALGSCWIHGLTDLYWLARQQWAQSHGDVQTWLREATKRKHLLVRTVPVDSWLALDSAKNKIMVSKLSEYNSKWCWLSKLMFYITEYSKMFQYKRGSRNNKNIVTFYNLLMRLYSFYYVDKVFILLSSLKITICSTRVSVWDTEISK